MKKSKDIKIGILVFLIMVVAISIIATYSSYAFVTTTVENVTGYDYTFVMDINEETDLNVIASATSKTIVDLTINNNNNNGTINYGLSYSVDGYENSDLLPDIDAYKNVTSKDNSIGTIEKDDNKKISIIINNKENVDLMVKIKPILGYQYGGDLIVKTGSHLIYNNLKEELLYANGGISTLLDKEISNDNGMYASIDNYGDTYYYKGENNNYLTLGKDSDGHDLVWKIIRINGDNSIRIMLNSDIGNVKYNNFDNDNAYVGYMYGTASQNNYEETHANTTNSNIKDILDKWYSKYLINYSNLIADTLYCNNRTNSVGYGTNNGYYVSYSKLNTQNTNLLCSKNDSFTTNDINNGNGSLTYSIGLITYDEVILSNISSNNNIWTMTPSSYTDCAKVFIYSDKTSEQNVSSEALVSPVISLKENIKVTGLGTKENPYKVITN